MLVSEQRIVDGRVRRVHRATEAGKKGAGRGSQGAGRAGPRSPGQRRSVGSAQAGRRGVGAAAGPATDRPALRPVPTGRAWYRQPAGPASPAGQPAGRAVRRDRRSRALGWALRRVRGCRRRQGPGRG
ncbi:hypothetical protein [Streptomyces soliscabiei]|uniref:hypothetical protein n=1 Tax=Streptomyces soliscabiei TaxID=588897 RepID=UPI0029ABB51B|nr:hypothetical protein [Streptomyces sp. NY05-11A]MDX2675388.1 hypothetical protein [Streptomyces sp. NY05-11A]